MSDEVKAGDRIVYAQADCGRVLDELGIVLVPGEVLTVDEDVDVEFAGRLVEDHVCRIVPAEADASEQEATPNGPTAQPARREARSQPAQTPTPLSGPAAADGPAGSTGGGGTAESADDGGASGSTDQVSGDADQVSGNAGQASENTGQASENTGQASENTGQTS